MKSRLKLLAALLLCLAAGLPAGPPKLKVFAAASLSESMQEIAGLYAKQGGGPVAYNFAASGALARQIQEGAPADILFSADESQLDRLDKAGLLKAGTRRDLLSNTLAVVLAVDSPLAVTTAADLGSVKFAKLAIGDPATVPAGTYARAWLEGEQEWDSVKGKAVPCDSVRGVLAAVESGNVDAGVVYRTDALISRKVRIAFEVSNSRGPAIRYPGAVIKNAPAGEEADRFLAFVQGAAASAVFQAHGFEVLSASARP